MSVVFLARRQWRPARNRKQYAELRARPRTTLTWKLSFLSQLSTDFRRMTWRIDARHSFRLRPGRGLGPRACSEAVARWGNAQSVPRTIEYAGPGAGPTEHA
jgi:hypothetical protein